MKLISTDQYIITKIDKEICRTQQLLKNLYNKFKSENNYINLDYATNTLANYAYIDNKFKLYDGRYVRYIDTTDAFDMKLKLGGFVIRDNGYTVTLKNDNRFFKVSKQGKYFFTLMNKQDAIRSYLTR